MFDLIPFRSRDRVSRNLMPDDFFENFFDSGFLSHMNELGRGIKVDVKEKNDNYIVEADLPGFRREDINIELKDNRLTISAERKEDIEEKGDNYLRKERKRGRLVRSFMVDNIKHDAVTARFENGLLEIVLPKEDKGQHNGRRIDIQ